MGDDQFFVFLREGAAAHADYTMRKVFTAGLSESDDIYQVGRMRVIAPILGFFSRTL